MIEGFRVDIEIKDNGSIVMILPKKISPQESKILAEKVKAVRIYKGFLGNFCIVLKDKDKTQKHNTNNNNYIDISYNAF